MYMCVSHTAHHTEEWRECSKKWSQHGIHSCHSKRWITFQKQSGPPLATQALEPGEGSERLQGQVTTNIFCSSALLHHSFLFFVFFYMRKPDIGSTVLISWGIWSTGPLACSLCWLFCHRFLHDWFPWQQRRCRPKQKTSWQCLWAETHEAEHLAKRCPQSNSMRLNETQWLQHYCQQFNYCNYCQLNCWTLQTLQAVLHTTWLPRASSASLTSFRLFWNSTARRALVWMLQVQVPHSP